MACCKSADTGLARRVGGQLGGVFVHRAFGERALQVGVTQAAPPEQPQRAKQQHHQAGGKADLDFQGQRHQRVQVAQQDQRPVAARVVPLHAGVRQRMAAPLGLHGRPAHVERQRRRRRTLERVAELLERADRRQLFRAAGASPAAGQFAPVAGERDLLRRQ
jgi:hypothetical protein